MYNFINLVVYKLKNVLCVPSIQESKSRISSRKTPIKKRQHRQHVKSGPRHFPNPTEQK